MPVAPLEAAASAHRAAWDAFQIAPGGDESDESVNACCAMGDALDALVQVACAFPILTRPLPEGASILLGHLRWWLAEEAGFAADYQPQYAILAGRAADLAAVLEPPAPDETDPVVAAIVAADMASAAVSAAHVFRDEGDEASEAEIEAAYCVLDEAFRAVQRTMPATAAGLYALAKFYERDARLYDRMSSGGDYFGHLAAAIRVCDSKGGFSGVEYRFSTSSQRLGSVIPQQVFGGAR